MPSFEKEGVAAALERAIDAASHLGAADAAGIAAARALARKIDAWDVIVGWALGDAAEHESRPAVPANDNVSIATFLKYLDGLRLLPTRAAGETPAAAPRNELEAFRAKRGIGTG